MAKYSEGPKTNETAFNHELARMLRTLHPRWRENISNRDVVAAEQTSVIDGFPKERPDIVIRHPGGMPVVVETEYEPASTVEVDAKKRLGRSIGGNAVEGVLAVRIPNSLAKRQTNLRCEIRQAIFEICVFSGPESKCNRLPLNGWFAVSLDRLAETIERVALSETRLASAADMLEEGISTAAVMLRGYRNNRPDMFTDIETILHQEDCEQTTRMAVAIIANAFVYQCSIAGKNGFLSPENLLENKKRSLKLNTIECWENILDVNYWPIFQLAKDLLNTIPVAVADKFLDSMIELSASLSGLGTTSLQDLSGQMFQRLITDRKFLATFYTLPSSASLLASLAVNRMQLDWNDPEAITTLRIADLACGTGALLGAAHHAVALRHRRGGGDDRKLHPLMLENTLIATDIMPAATHLTASIISSAHPGVTFDRTQIYTLPYGTDKFGDVHIGSLDMILDDKITSLLGGSAGTSLGGSGKESVHNEAVVAEGSCHLVIMNPPFTNPTNHEIADVPVPSFAGFQTAEDEQHAMSAQLKEIRKKLSTRYRTYLRSGQVGSCPAGHGNAGLASNFIDLVHAKLQPGGCLALVLPASFPQGAAWEGARQLLADQYRDVMIIGIATHGSTDRSFSADTGMAEVLLVATRCESEKKTKNETIIAVNLDNRPSTPLEGSLVADALESVRTQNTEMTGQILLGENIPVGNWHSTTNQDFAFAVVGLKHHNLAEAVSGLAEGGLNLPRCEPVKVPMVRLDNLGFRGKLDRDINGRNKNGPRGPFDLKTLKSDEYPDYPVLWAHNAKREKHLVVAPDNFGLIRSGYDEKAIKLFEETASRLHFNRDFQINSQPLAACFTERKSIGGRAWPNYILEKQIWEFPVLLWANTTLGLISFWLMGTRQHDGRSGLTISRLPHLLTLDVRSLSLEQLGQCEEIFEDFRNREFLPANEAYQDKVRQDLDEAILIGLLGLDKKILVGLKILREQWCREPSVCGTKSTKPDIA